MKLQEIIITKAPRPQGPNEAKQTQIRIGLHFLFRNPIDLEESRYKESEKMRTRPAHEHYLGVRIYLIVDHSLALTKILHFQVCELISEKCTFFLMSSHDLSASRWRYVTDRCQLAPPMKGNTSIIRSPKGEAKITPPTIAPKNVDFNKPRSARGPRATKPK